MIILMVLTGCTEEQLQTAVDDLCYKPDKSELATVIKKANDLDESEYTTVSYSSNRNTVSFASAVMYDENAVQQEVDVAMNKLNNGLNAMVKATKGGLTIVGSVVEHDNSSAMLIERV